MLVLATSSRQLSIPLREFGLHVVTRPGVPWVVVTGHAYVVAIDLREVWPEQIDLPASGGMVGVAPNSVVVDAIVLARVLDVGARTHLDLEPLPMPRTFDAFDRAVIARAGADKRAIQVVPLDGGEVIVLPDVEATALTLAGGALVTGTAAGDVVARPLDGGPAHALAHLPAAILGLHDLGPWLIAVAADGSLWRRGHGGEATAKLDGTPASVTVAADGVAYVVIGRDVFRWPAGAAPAPFAHAALDLTGFAYPGARAIPIIGDDHAVYRLDRADGSVGLALPTSRWGFGISVDGTTATRVDDQGLLRVADLDAGVGWTLPTESFHLTDAEPSPDGQVIFASGGLNGVLRYANDLPRDPAALRAWIATRSNARASTQLGAVEWQLPEPTAVR